MTQEISSVDIGYNAVRARAVSFAFKPEERINEGALAKELGISRTPLREAMNRLVAEGFLTFKTGLGFYCRALDPAGIVDLYEARQAVECEGLRLAGLRAGDLDIQAVANFLDEISDEYSSASDVERRVELDEAFHMALIRLSGNAELAKILENLNARSRYVRWVDMEDRPEVTPMVHMNIVKALAARDAARADALMRDHIGRSRDQATGAVQRAYLKLYVPR